MLVDAKYCTENGQHLIAPSRGESTYRWLIEVAVSCKDERVPRSLDPVSGLIP